MPKYANLESAVTAVLNMSMQHKDLPLNVARTLLDDDALSAVKAKVQESVLNSDPSQETREQVVMYLMDLPTIAAERVRLF